MFPSLRPPYEEARSALMSLAQKAVATVRTNPRYFDELAEIARRYYRGDFAGFLDELGRSGLK
jgi:hypothetical protein